MFISKDQSNFTIKLSRYFQKSSRPYFSKVGALFDHDQTSKIDRTFPQDHDFEVRELFSFFSETFFSLSHAYLQAQGKAHYNTFWDHGQDFGPTFLFFRRPLAITNLLFLDQPLPTPKKIKKRKNLVIRQLSLSRKEKSTSNSRQPFTKIKKHSHLLLYSPYVIIYISKKGYRVILKSGSWKWECFLFLFILQMG